MNDKEIIWDRLKNGMPPHPTFGMDMEKMRLAWMQASRGMGKTTMAMQAFGRAMRGTKE